MKEHIQISGIYMFNNTSGVFSGTVTLEERENVVYYSWNLLDEGGNMLGGKSKPISFQQVPPGQDRLEFSKAHAVRGIRDFRIGRERIVLELNVLE